MLIGFTGKLGSGKDTAGERFANLVEEEGIRLSFARPLKESAAALLDIDPLDWETYKNDPDVQIHLTVGYREPHFALDSQTGNAIGELEEPNVVRTFTAREFLQRYGTEAHRDVFGQDFWVEQAMRDYFRSRGYFHYVTDCRFENEAKSILAHNGLIIRVLGANEETGTHVSEAGLPDEYINFVIDNSVRGDDFRNLDLQLYQLAQTIGLTPSRGYTETYKAALEAYGRA